MKKIYFVRHGQSQANVDDIASGGGLETPLTDVGRYQAKIAGEDLKNKNIDLIVSSPLSRAVETAKIIAKEIGYSPKEIVINPIFIERGFGIYEGGPYSDYLNAVHSDRLDASAEQPEVIHKRIVDGLEWLKKQDAQNILLVSHGVVNRVLRLIHQELPLSDMYKIDVWPNGAIYEFEL